MLPAQMVDYYNPTGPPPPPPPPMIPSAQTAFVSPLQLPVPPSHSGLVTGSTYAATHPPPSGGLVVTAPPPPGPPPPPPGPPAAGASLSSSPMHAPPVSEAKQAPMSDARSDLLAAIRMGKCTLRFRSSLFSSESTVFSTEMSLWLLFPAGQISLTTSTTHLF